VTKKHRGKKGQRKRFLMSQGQHKPNQQSPMYKFGKYRALVFQFSVLLYDQFQKRMILSEPKTLQELAQFLGCQFVGDPNHQITGINEIHKVVPGDLVFVDFEKYYKKALHSAATTILIDKEVDCPEGKGLLISAKPFDDFNKLTKHFRPDAPNTGHMRFTEVDPSSWVAPNASIGDFVTIGKNCKIHPGAVIQSHTIIGNNVIIGPNSVIGHYAFYYKKKPEGFEQMHSCGRTILEDDVEIGALCTVDKGVSGDTIIGRGTKLDNQVHIGHDTVIGENCLFAAHVGIAGCVTIKNRVTCWGQVGIASDVVIEDGVTILAQSGVNKNLEAGKTYFGSPAADSRVKFREMAAIKKLPEILESL
jgi:UDP-3-O-[3-hydroxymyristoyl] glucosamine N-acyltransferase